MKHIEMVHEAQMQKQKELQAIQETTMPRIGQSFVEFIDGEFSITGLFDMEEAEQLRDWLISSLKEAVVKRSDKPKRKPRKQKEHNA